MREAHQTSKVREAERELMALVPDGALMRRAAAGLGAISASLIGKVYGSRVVILAGSGDNGGDALFAGALLARRGAAVTAIAVGARVHEAGAKALRAAGGRVTHGTDAGDHEVRHAIGHANLIVDGMLGIGGKGGLRDPYATLASLAEQSRVLTVAVDLPSGVDADTGTVDGPAVRADVTVTFGTYKPGLFIDPGASFAGVVELVDIGLGPFLLDPPDVMAPGAADIAAVLPEPGVESDKYRRGVLGLLAGSERFTGAAVLATGGAVRGGAGMIRLVTASQAAAAVRRQWPEVVITEDSILNGTSFPEGVGRVQAWCAGPGMGVTAEAAGRLAGILATSLPAAIDADGLGLLARRPDLLPREAPTLLTPHAGELARLLGTKPDGEDLTSEEVTARRLEYARQVATRFGACVLLKGSTTVIASPDSVDPVLVNPTGTPWLATAGTGDVLAGLAGALLAQGLLPPQAALAAAYLHGLAARIAAYGQVRPDGGLSDGKGPSGGGSPAGGPLAAAPIGASDVVRALPEAYHALEASRNSARARPSM
jgi:hydroxyethylthiazole kinase-like uncharacterized protein yjeF